MNPTVVRAVIDADRVAATFRRALDRLDDAALYSPDSARPPDGSLMRVRRTESPALWEGPHDLASRYTVALRSVHETLAALMVLDQLAGSWAGVGRASGGPRPSWRRVLLPVAEARSLVDALLWALDGCRRAALPPGDEGWVLLALEPLGALRGGFWPVMSWRECREGCGRRAELDRATCYRCRPSRRRVA